MFDSSRFADLETAVADATGTRLDLASPEQLADVLRATRSLIDRLEGLESQALHRFDAVDGYEVDSASSLTGWVRRELRMSPQDARARVKAGRTLTQLPQVAAAMQAGSIRLAHVRGFGLGITKGRC